MNAGERVIERVLCQMSTVILREITFIVAYTRINVKDNVTYSNPFKRESLLN